MTKRTKVMAMLACAFAAAATIAGGSIAMAGTAESSGNQLAGTWSVTVNRPAPLPPLQSLQVYTRAGSMVESGNDSGSRSPQYASWVRLHGHEYAATGIFFRFDPQTGALVGTQKINRTIVMSEDGQSFTFSGRATVYDANGNAIAGFPGSGVGQRLEVETQP